jgi:hypothetical protein
LRFEISNLKFVKFNLQSQICHLQSFTMFDINSPQSQSETALLRTALVTLISVNLHALIWVLQPVIPIATKPLSQQRLVQLVELTPAEMKRLPEFSRPATMPILPSIPSTNTSPDAGPARSNIPLPPPPSRPRTIAAPRTTPTSAPTPTPTATQTFTPLPSSGGTFENALVKSRLGYNPTGTTEAEAAEKLAAWLKKNRRLTRNIELRRPIPQKILSPIGDKLPDATPIEIAVLVNPKGKIVGGPELIRSSGYEKLNSAALADVKKRSFPPTGKHSVYQYRIEQVAGRQNNTSPPSVRR